MANFGRDHSSIGPLSNLQPITQATKMPEDIEKTKFLVAMSNFGKVSRENSAAAKG
jgi:hypothetical protein